MGHHNRDNHQASRDNIINRAVLTGLEEEEPDVSIEAALASFGRNVQCDRICIFEDNLAIPGYADSTYEWCTEGVISIKDRMQAIPYHGVWDDCIARLEQRRPFIIRDRETYRQDNPNGYKAMLQWGALSVIAYPLYIGEQYFGFIRIDNPNLTSIGIDEIRMQLEAMSGFFAPMLRLRNNMRTMKRMAESDFLTKTYNIVAFKREVRAYLDEPGRQEEEHYLIYVDMLNFRKYNALYGSEEGDKALVKVSEILRRVFHTERVSRLIGDRFAVCYTGDEVAAAAEQAHDLCLYADLKLPLYIKMGIVRMEEGESVYQCIDHAQLACERLGDARNGCYGFLTVDMKNRIDREQYILDHFDQALSEHWIKVWFQPIVRTMTEKLCGAEALARWEDPVYGIISPGEFIPVLEKHELCWRLDTHVVDQVCRLMGERQAAGRQVVPISVNLSRNDFSICDPVELVQNICEEHGIAHQYLCIEITESQVMQSKKEWRAFIDQFIASGFQVWMDDFGNAYSSLNALSELNFSKIKMDMGFMVNLDDHAKIIVQAAVQMAKKLGIRTLCEGVETREQLDFLREIGCEEVQGFYYGKPAPLEVVEANMETKKIPMETLEQAHVMMEIGKIPLSEHANQMIIKYCGRNASCLYVSDQMRHILGTMGMTCGSAMEQSRSSVTSRQIWQLFESVAESGEEKRVIAKVEEQTYMFQCRTILYFEDATVELLECIDTTVMWDKRKYEYLYHCAAGAYEEIYLLNPDDGQIEVIHSTLIGETVGERMPLEQCLLTQRMHREDQNRLLMVLDEKGRRNILTKMTHGSYTGIFRIVMDHGEFLWIACSIIDVIADGRQQYLLCIKPSAVEDYLEREQLISTVDNMTFPYRLEQPFSRGWHSEDGRGGSIATMRRDETIRNLQIENLTDHLTGARNRRYFDREVVGKTVSAVAFIDIDNFKAINDAHGHDAGDVVLKKISATIRRTLRSTDIVVRYGGDEFVVVFETITEIVLRQRLKDIIEKVRQLTFPEVDAEDIRATVSIGACCRRDEAENMMHEADVNMYRSKRNGKGNVTVTN